MKKKVLLILALLCTIVQGAWADDDYGYPTKTKPEFHDSYGGKSNVVVINTAAELAYITEHFYEDSDFPVDRDDWSQLDYYLNADIDMGTEHSWLPMGVGSNTGYSGKFWGNGHTITYYIWDLDEEGQGLFSTIHTYGRVYDVNVICKIYSHRSLVGGIAGKSWGHIENCTATVNILCHEVHCVGGIVGYTYSGAFVAGCHVMGRIECTGPSMQVGGITGCIDGAYITTVRNCWVEADIITDEAPSLYNADVGGIAGQNEYCVEYCCMTGNVTVKGKETGVGGIVGSNEKTVSHCTFYGTVSVNKDQKNKYVGGEAPAASSDNMYDAFNQDECNDAKSKGYDLYCQAIKYPYAVNVKSYGIGGLNEINPRFQPGETVWLTVMSESRELKEISVKTVSGSDITVYRNSPSDYFFIMPARDVNVVAWFDHFEWPTEGEGTAEDPYTIRSSSEWGTFASRVAASEDDKDRYEGKYIRLETDLTVTEMIGYDDFHPFKGTFLGNGHTLTFNQNIYPEHDEIPWQGISPFHYINGATIKDLKVAGTITSQTVYTSGLVGFAEGTNLIENCVVTTTLNISSDYAGGIVGNGLNSNTTIKNCVFAGTINGVDGDRANIGGILGYCNGATPTLENCLEKGTYTNIASMHPMGLQGGSGTITNCYYVTPQIGSPNNACNVSGAQQARTISAGEGVIISSLGEATATSVDGGITAYSKGIKYDGTYYAGNGETVSLELSHGSKTGYTFSQYVASAGTLSGTTLTMPDADVTISAVWTGFALSGSGTANDPYIIGNTDDWNTFAGCVNQGNTFTEEYVKLTADISVTTMAGTDTSNSFQGIFDGDNHTLTFNNGTAESPFSEAYCAPFRHVKNAAIKDLHVDGTIYISAQKAAGFVGESHGSLTIMDCRSSVNINSSTSGDGTHGGFVSTLSGARNTIIIDGCVFDGSFATTAGTTKCAGFIGWPVWNRPTIMNSLMKPGSVAAGMLNNTFARWHTTDGVSYEPTITNCYYVETANLPTNQGTEAAVLNITPANPDYDYGLVKAYKNGIWFDGNFYGTPATVTLADNADNSETISSVNGYVADVTLSGRTLYKDGAWNTLCLPFNVTIAGSPLAGATARPLKEGSISGTTLNLYFDDNVTTLQAGTPYIIKWTKADDYVDDNEHNLVNPVFHGVTIDKTERNYDNGVSGDKRVHFKGTYKSTTFGSEDKSILLMGGSNTLYWPQLGASIGAQRAYFKLGEDASGARITSFSIGFGDDDNTTTGIIEAEANSSLYPLPSTVAEGWYDLQGRKIDNDKLSNGKMPRGVYIRGGRKVVVK